MKKATARRNTLSTSEEVALCHRWHEHHDVAAAERLVTGHLHIVAGMAMAHRGYGVLVQELIGEGYVGLMRAACRYDPACGASFASYATWCVQAAIQQSVLSISPSMQTDTAGIEASSAMPAPFARDGARHGSVQLAQ